MFQYPLLLITNTNLLDFFFGFSEADFEPFDVAPFKEYPLELYLNKHGEEKEFIN